MSFHSWQNYNEENLTSTTLHGIALPVTWRKKPGLIYGPAHILHLRILRDTVKTMTLQTLAEYEKAPTCGLSQRFSAKFNNLSCWLLPQNTNFSCINFDLFLRGFIPKELSTIIKSVVSTQEF